MSDDKIKAFVERLRKMATGVYIAVEPSVADDLADGFTQAADLIEAAEARAEKLAEALRFYVDKARYDNDTRIDRGDGTEDWSCSVLDDEGIIARAALEPNPAGETCDIEDLGIPDPY